MQSTAELNDLAMILAAAFLGGALLRQLRQPVLIGYILVGTIFGPAGLGLVENADDIQWLAELGILLLMFYIGLEMDLSQFRAVARPAVVTTLIQIAVGVGVMYGVGFITGWPFKTAFLLGCCIAVSSTAVALKVLEEMDAKRTHGGAVSMGILIAQDISVVPMMLILGAMRMGGTVNLMGLVKLIAGLLILAAVMWLLSEQPQWFMHWGRKFARVKAKAMKGQTTITALAVCFTGAALAGALGFSAAYGAFLAGLMLSRTRSREKVQKNTRPVFDLLIMVFFLSVGLLIDLHFIIAHWLTVAGLVIGALMLKTLLNVAVLRLQKVPAPDAWLAGAVTGQLGEFSFLLAGMGIADGSLDDGAHKYVLAVISLSLVCTPLWLALLHRLRLIPKVTITPGEALESAARGVVKAR